MRIALVNMVNRPREKTLASATFCDNPVSSKISIAADAGVRSRQGVAYCCSGHLQSHQRRQGKDHDEKVDRDVRSSDGYPGCLTIPTEADWQRSMPIATDRETDEERDQNAHDRPGHANENDCQSQLPRVQIRERHTSLGFSKGFRRAYLNLFFSNRSMYRRQIDSFARPSEMANNS